MFYCVLLCFIALRSCDSSVISAFPLSGRCRPSVVVVCSAILFKSFAVLFSRVRSPPPPTSLVPHSLGDFRFFLFVSSLIIFDHGALSLFPYGPLSVRYRSGIGLVWGEDISGLRSVDTVPSLAPLLFHVVSPSPSPPPNPLLSSLSLWHCHLLPLLICDANRCS